MSIKALQSMISSSRASVSLAGLHKLLQASNIEFITGPLMVESTGHCVIPLNDANANSGDPPLRLHCLPRLVC